MALTKAQLKEILSNAGVEADKLNETATKILEGHTASIEALREERDELKSKLSKASEQEEELKRLQKEAEDKAGKDYETLKKEFDDYKDKVAKQEKRSAKEKAFTAILKDLGISEKHFSKIIKYSDIDSMELDDKGEVVNAKDLRKSIKDEWSDHIDKKTTTGADTATPPQRTGGATKTKAEIVAIKDTKERQAAWKEYMNAQNGDQGVSVDD